MRWRIVCLTLALAGITWTAVGEETSTMECRPELLAPVNVLDTVAGEPAKCLQLETAEKRQSEPAKARLFSDESLEANSDTAEDYALLPATNMAVEPVSEEAKLGYARLVAVEPPSEKPKSEWKNAGPKRPSVYDVLMFDAPPFKLTVRR
jgi:hypothetical protein